MPAAKPVTAIPRAVSVDPVTAVPLTVTETASVALVPYSILTVEEINRAFTVALSVAVETPTLVASFVATVGATPEIVNSNESETALKNPYDAASIWTLHLPAPITDIEVPETLQTPSFPVMLE